MILTAKTQFVRNVEVGEKMKKLVLVEIFVDSASDLPTSDCVPGYILAMGSHAIDVSTGAEYRINSSGVWINQSTGTKTIQITQQPESAEVTAGDEVTFTVAASGYSLSYKWQSSSDGTTWADISGATSASYTFTSAAADSGKSYHCIITDGDSNTATSSAAELTVNEPVQEPAPENESSTEQEEGDGAEQNNGG